MESAILLSQDVRWLGAARMVAQQGGTWSLALICKLLQGHVVQQPHNGLALHTTLPTRRASAHAAPLTPSRRRLLLAAGLHVPIVGLKVVAVQEQRVCATGLSPGSGWRSGSRSHTMAPLRPRATSAFCDSGLPAASRQTATAVTGAAVLRQQTPLLTLHGPGWAGAVGRCCRRMARGPAGGVDDAPSLCLICRR